MHVISRSAHSTRLGDASLSPPGRWELRARGAGGPGRLRGARWTSCRALELADEPTATVGQRIHAFAAAVPRPPATLCGRYVGQLSVSLANGVTGTVEVPRWQPCLLSVSPSFSTQKTESHRGAPGPPKATQLATEMHAPGMSPLPSMHSLSSITPWKTHRAPLPAPEGGNHHWLTEY